jgi:hypothetical protein
MCVCIYIYIYICVCVCVCVCVCIGFFAVRNACNHELLNCTRESQLSMLVYVCVHECTSCVHAHINHMTLTPVLQHSWEPMLLTNLSTSMHVFSRLIIHCIQFFCTCAPMHVVYPCKASSLQLHVLILQWFLSHKACVYHSSWIIHAYLHTYIHNIHA